MRKTVEEYIPELHDMYGVKYELTRVNEPNRIARQAIVTLRCPLHGEETTSRLNNFLAYKYGQYDIASSPSNVKINRRTPQTVCTFPCARCRELKLSPVVPHVLSDSGKAQRVANYLFSYLRRNFGVKHLGEHEYEVTCQTHAITMRHSRKDIKRNPDKVCLGCYVDINFQAALSALVGKLGYSNFQYEVLNYPTQDTEIHIINDGSRHNVLELLP
jgi:hypothetical protein